MSVPMERWRRWGLTLEEWRDCVEAAGELAEISMGERTPSADEIAAQLAVAKAAEQPLPPSDEPLRHVPLEGR